MFTTRIKRLISRPPRLLLWGSSGVTVGPDGGGPPILVISRAHCHYRLFKPVDGGNAAKTKAALALMIRNWAPYKDYDYVAVEAGSNFMVWVWDRQEAAKAMEQSGLKPGRSLCLPETLFIKKGSDGIRLVRCMDGFEAQNWSGSVLRDSRWWPNMPSPAEWLAVQRAASIRPAAMTTSLPTVGNQAALEAPWGGIGSSALTVFGRISPTEMAYGAVFAACLPIVFMFAEYVRVGQDLSKINAKLASLQSSAGPILDAREKAFSELDRVKGLLALDPYPPQVQLMARVSSLIVADGTRIVDWNFQHGDLDVGLQTSNGIDARSYVQRYETAGPFKEVTIDRNNPLITFLRMKVKTLAEAAQANQQAQNIFPNGTAGPLPMAMPNAGDLPIPVPDGPPRSEEPAIIK